MHVNAGFFVHNLGLGAVISLQALLMCVCGEGVPELLNSSLTVNELEDPGAIAGYVRLEENLSVCKDW